MFQSPEPLNMDKHARLKLSRIPDYRFAAKEIVSPVVSGEMWQISREYIMVFPKGVQGLPLALMGTQSGVNTYVGEGNPPWWGRYVPAHLRRYPFAAALKPGYQGQPEGQQYFTVLIDTKAPQLSEEHGQPLFTENGQATPLLQEVQKALMSLQQDSAITQELVRQIDEAGLLIDQVLTINPVGGEPVGLQGFRIIDQKRLREASSALLSQLIKTHALDLIYAHICSLSNLQDGLLAKKAAGAVRTTVSEEELREMFADDAKLEFDWNRLQ